MITEQSKQNILDTADVYDVLSDFLDLKRNGTRYLCCCPFHNERTPSFTVDTNRNRWHCFGCNEHGDAVAFLMKYQNMSFTEALKWLANKYHIEIKYERREQSEAEREAHLRREAMLIAVDAVQKFFVEQLYADNSDAEQARQYAFARWGEQFCKEYGIGYAPKASATLFDYIKRKMLSLSVLKEVGIIGSGERGDYAFFRERIIIPIRDKMGRTIAFTARYVGADPDIAKRMKYVNSPSSPLFKKEEMLFGIDTARRQARITNSFILVEGAPDVLRLNAINLNEAVAPLGTALTVKQLNELRTICKTIRFVPDSDPPKGKVHGSGVLAVINNGTLAMQNGFTVYVREIPRTTADDENDIKYDPDSFFKNREDYSKLDEKPFVVWLAEKHNIKGASQDRQIEIVNEIADLLVLIDDALQRDMCIDKLCALFGKPKTWKDAMKRATRKIQEKAEEICSEYDPKEQALLRKHGLIIKNNMYYAPGKEDGLERLSNFILRPVFHIKHKDKGLRVFRIINEYGHEEPLEISQKTFSSVQSFQVAVESLGAYVWLAKQDKHNRVKEYLYNITPSAENINILGWQNKYKFYAFADGIHTGEQFIPINEVGIVSYQGNSFYLPAFSSMYANDVGAYDFERMIEYRNGNTDTLREYCNRIFTVFGDGGKVGFAWVLACLFRDHIFKVKDWFPMLNLFGIKGSGKSALAVALTSFFYTMKQDPPKLGNTTVPAMSYMFGHVRNAIIVLDEYTNLLKPKIIDILKGIWGGTANTKMNMGDGEKGINAAPVYSGVIFCGQHQPTYDTAVFSRCVHLQYYKVVFSVEENEAFTALKEAAKRGNAHLTMDIMRNRSHFEDTFESVFEATRKEVKVRFGKELVQDRILDNWVVALTSFRVLETFIDVPMTYAELFEICIKGIRLQDREANKTSETSDFWGKLSALHTMGKVLDGTHFSIKYKRSFTPEKSSETIQFPTNKPLLYLNWSAVQTVLEQRIGTNQMKLDIGALDNYLRNSQFFLGIKQKRFAVLLPNGTPEIVFEQNARKERTKPVRALVFDYEALRNTCDIDLETSVISLAMDEIDDEQPTQQLSEPMKPIQESSLF